MTVLWISPPSLALDYMERKFVRGSRAATLFQRPQGCTLDAAVMQCTPDMGRVPWAVEVSKCYAVCCSVVEAVWLQKGGNMPE